MAFLGGKTFRAHENGGGWLASRSSGSIQSNHRPSTRRRRQSKPGSSKAQTMARRPGTDERQSDFFGAPAPKPETPSARPSRPPKHERSARGEASPPEHRGAPVNNEPEKLVAGLSPADLNEFVALLPDDALARLVIAAVRQLRRRRLRAKNTASKGKNVGPGPCGAGTHHRAERGRRRQRLSGLGRLNSTSIIVRLGGLRR